MLTGTFWKESTRTHFKRESRQDMKGRANHGQVFFSKPFSCELSFHFFHEHVHVKMLTDWEKQRGAFPRFSVGPGICWFPETQLWKSWLCHTAFKFLADSEWVCSWVTERGDYWFPLVRPMGVIFQSGKWVLTPIAGDHCPRDILLTRGQNVLAGRADQRLTRLIQSHHSISEVPW